MNGPLPVAKINRWLPGSTTAPARPQIAESLEPQLLGSMIWCRSLQRVLKTLRILPVLREISST